jgi:hypothetical protein
LKMKSRDTGHHLHALHALHALFGPGFVTPAGATRAAGANGAQACRMEEALASAALRHNVHLKREQQSVRTADFAKMPKGGARGACRDVLLGGGGGFLHPAKQGAAVHVFQVRHTVHIVLPKHVVARGEEAEELGALGAHAHKGPAAQAVT